MPFQILRDAGANLAACSRGVRRYCHRLYRRILGRDGAPQQGEDVQQRGRVANPLVILVTEILATDISVSRAMVAQLGFGLVYGVAVSALHLPLGRRTRLRTVLALAGVVPAAVYLLPGGPTLHVVPMIIISAGAGTEIQHNLLFRSRNWTADSVLRPQSSVECLLMAWLIAVGGNVKEVSHFIQAGAVLCLDVLCSSIATRSLTKFFLRVVLVTLGLAIETAEVRSHALLKDRKSVREAEENPAANGVLPLQKNELPVPAWGEFKKSFEPWVEQWMD
ncbi:uncharacterized protein CCOS01_11095 [Colletotrichum costaricense]|uniref:Uncharacterized protein n=1 Tax=Colletotrichum costaricense TaxID=1209916 RepID=A0AAJ0DXF6_9PEZI|nr:uncharacterized protein CCOS01_11095 [Colletotrichum costaricense]KAK1519444.1 hypothetical protein CCOS01_11095 [Colletotrichum costaricense]